MGEELVRMNYEKREMMVDRRVRYLGISVVFRGGLVGGTGVRSKGPICGVQSEEDVEWRV